MFVSMQYSLAFLPLAREYIIYAIAQVNLCSVQNVSIVGFNIRASKIGRKSISYFISAWADQRCRMGSYVAYTPLTQQYTPCSCNHSKYIVESGLCIWLSDLICLKFAFSLGYICCKLWSWVVHSSHTPPDYGVYITNVY